MDQVVNILNIFWDVIETWWWLPLPFLLYRPFLFLWLWWRRERWISAQKFVVLEIKMPKEILKPLRAMEQVFSSFWGNIYDPADWWEKWIEGKTLLSMSLDVVSLGGEPHFYIRAHESRIRAVESSVYSQYPDAEISAVDDYTKYVPQNIPNKDWDLWGCDYVLAKSDVYPIKTYPKFFEEKTDAKEEKRIDPMATLLEGMATLGPGEQLWVQIIAEPVANQDNHYVERGRAVADKLAKRPDKVKGKPLLQEAVEELVTGNPPAASGKEELKLESLLPVEARMTPGERDIVAGVEGKIAKQNFKSYFRFIYLAKRDVYFGGAKAVPFGHFQQFATENLNSPRPWSKTITKIHKKPIPFFNMLRLRRLFIRKRKLFRNYTKRLPPLFPNTTGGTFILDTEELATLFHFPGKAVAAAPFVPRVESKRGEAPPGLPTE